MMKHTVDLESFELTALRSMVLRELTEKRELLAMIAELKYDPATESKLREQIEGEVARLVTLHVRLGASN